MVKNLLPMQGMRVPSLVWEDPLEKEMATHSSMLAWDISLAESLADHSPWGHRVRHDLATKQQQNNSDLCIHNKDYNPQVKKQA